MKTIARCLFPIYLVVIPLAATSFALLPAAAQVQATNGRIQGDITDSAGGAIPQASVDATEDGHRRHPALAYR